MTSTPLVHSSVADLDFDLPKALSRLMRFLAVPGITGHEKAIGQAVIEALIHAKVPRREISLDDANERIPIPTETGNLIVMLPGTRPGPRRMLMPHLDPVPFSSG